ncbi:unnamed protein product, partial [Candidula unifasciata]
VLNWFYSYGHFLAQHPFCFLIIPILICGGLAVGLTNLQPKDGVEYLYAPSISRSIDERDIVRQTFTDKSDTNFSPFSLNELVPESEIIFRSKKEKSILTGEVLQELKVSVIGIFFFKHHVSLFILFYNILFFNSLSPRGFNITGPRGSQKKRKIGASC